jgi:peptidoglycan hydrolase-like amidase
MICSEPLIRIGILQQQEEIQGIWNGTFVTDHGAAVSGSFSVRSRDGILTLFDQSGKAIASGNSIVCSAATSASTCTLSHVTIGKQFHWEQQEQQTFEGNFRFLSDEDSVTVVNEIGIETYLQSVISSEMSATAPMELLKAHAITSRSWLAAMLQRQERRATHPAGNIRGSASETDILRWYDRDEHRLFDVCADDHCQRYHGITKILSPAAVEAVTATRGCFLTFQDEICDARFSKCCGGFT